MHLELAEASLVYSPMVVGYLCGRATTWTHSLGVPATADTEHTGPHDIFGSVFEMLGVKRVSLVLPSKPNADVTRPHGSFCVGSAIRHGYWQGRAVWVNYGNSRAQEVPLRVM